MRKNGANSAYIETENVLSLKSQKSPGIYSRQKIEYDNNASNHKRSCVKHYSHSRNCVWSYHLMSMVTNNGQLIWIFSVIDEYTQEYLRCLAAHSISAQNVIDELFSLF